MKKHIEFLWGSEKRIRIGQAGESDSFFYEAYRQAMAGVAEIVNASISYTRDEGSDSFFHTDDDESDSFRESPRLADKFFYNYPSNIIVFSGDRGTGKSSAMLTFVKGLEDHKSKLYDEKFLNEMIANELPYNVDHTGVLRMLTGCRFISLPPVDPTTLESSDQILTIILARMFQLAADTWENHSYRRSEEQKYIDKKNDLMRNFSKCYDHISVAKDADKKALGLTDLDRLADLGDGSQLKEDLTRLVECLLEFICLNDRGEPYLVLQIDDTDMNIEKAYTILEDIRKYLMIPRVIIVMAADLKHLKGVVESNLLSSYNANLDRREEYASRIAQQYITKLFPQTRQINLPDLGMYYKEHADSIKIVYKSFQKTLLPEVTYKASKSKWDSEEQILRLIYRKTGLVFLKSSDQLHHIIPQNMRLHAHFLSMLVQMKDVVNPDNENTGYFLSESADEREIEDYKEKLLARFQNLLRFRDYFLTTWATNNLSEKDAQRLTDIEQIGIPKKVYLACRYLGEKCNYMREECNYMINDPSKCNYSTMVKLCRRVEQSSYILGDSEFVFAIQTYFSLLGHSIVLEELISFCEKTSWSKPLSCSFDKLYYIFGSTIFPSKADGKIDDDDECNVRFHPTGVDESTWEILSRRWKADIGDLMNSVDPKFRPYVGLFFSMLADYRHNSRSDARVVLDLCTAIINCLYMRIEERPESSPHFKALFRIGSFENNITIDRQKWISLRESALLTVLNWDVLNTVWQRLIDMNYDGKTKQSERASNKPADPEWIDSVINFYSDLASPFQNGYGNIAALGKIRFVLWFEEHSKSLPSSPESPWSLIPAMITPYFRHERKAEHKYVAVENYTADTQVTKAENKPSAATASSKRGKKSSAATASSNHEKEPTRETQSTTDGSGQATLDPLPSNEGER